VCKDGVDHSGLVVHLQIHLFHTQQIDQVVPKGRPIATQDRVLSVEWLGLGADVRDVHPGGIGPRIGVYVPQRRAGQRMRRGLSPPQPDAFDAEGGAAGRAGRQHNLRTLVAREHAAEIVAEPLP